MPPPQDAIDTVGAVTSGGFAGIGVYLHWIVQANEVLTFVALAVSITAGVMTILHRWRK